MVWWYIVPRILWFSLQKFASCTITDNCNRIQGNLNYGMWTSSQHAIRLHKENTVVVLMARITFSHILDSDINGFITCHHPTLTQWVQGETTATLPVLVMSEVQHDIRLVLWTIFFSRMALIDWRLVPPQGKVWFTILISGHTWSSLV